MKKYKLLSILFVVATVLLFGMESNSQALTLFLSDGTNSLTIKDGDLNDDNPDVGAVTFVGNIGNWKLNVPTGISYPIQGSENQPFLDLNSIDVTNKNGGQLTIAIVEDGFTGPISGNFAFDAGGTIATGGSIKFDAIIDQGNSEDDFIGALIQSLGPFNTPSFSSSASGIFNPSSFPFALGIVAVINHQGAGTTSFDASLSTSPVPIPGAAWLLGAGLIGLVGIRRRILP